jgi:hypothetical protein
MSLPISSSRPITVEGRSYRWAVSRVESSWALLVQAASGPGRLLALELRCECEGMFWLEDEGRTHVGAVTPRWVRTVVERARGIGWDPTEPGTWFWTHFSGDGLAEGRRASA